MFYCSIFSTKASFSVTKQQKYTLLREYACHLTLPRENFIFPDA